jgi:hypothetical protein
MNLKKNDVPSINYLRVISFALYNLSEHLTLGKYRFLYIKFYYGFESNYRIVPWKGHSDFKD